MINQDFYEKVIKLDTYKGAEKMTDLELRQKAAALAAQLRDKRIPDEEIILQVKEDPELVHAECLSGANLFLEAVIKNRFYVAKTLSEMGADVHWTCKASMFNGNALNVAILLNRQIGFLSKALRLRKICHSPFLSHSRILQLWRYRTTTRSCCSIGWESKGSYLWMTRNM